MAVEPDLIAGMITLTNGDDVFTGTGTSWLLSGGRAGDMIIDLPGTPYQGVVKEITSDTSGVLTKPWDGPTLTSAYRYRFQPDGSRVPAEARNLIELLGNGNLQAAAALTGSANQVIMFTGPGAMTTISKAELTSGANYDVQVDALADRDAYDGQAEGFSVLISDMGDGRSAITSRVTATTGVWSDPAYVTGPIGETPDVTVGTVTTGAPGTDAEVTANPVTGGVELDFTIPAGEGFSAKGAYSGATAYAKGDVVRDAGSSWIALQATTGNAPPTLPTTSNAYWELLAAKGQDGTGTGDVVGPSGATSNRLAVYDGGTGKLLKDGGKLVDDIVSGPATAVDARVAVYDGATGKLLKDGGKTVAELTPVYATQAEQEAGSTTSAAVTPGRQQFHPSAAKAWAVVVVTGGVPSITGSYNITSVTDLGVGNLEVVIATDFSSNNWAPFLLLQGTGSATSTASLSRVFTKSAGSVEFFAFDTASAVRDPVVWYFSAFGDQ